MLRLELNFPTPAENLAADEALLDWCEAGHGGEMLLFWEPRQVFVVVGYANKVATEVNVAACETRGVPIFRRCSGGGTVVQMPGGLNYSLILRLTENGPTHSISSTNNFVMEKNRDAIESEVGGQRSEVSIAIRGHTDLARITHLVSRITELKFAGNAQRRRKHFLLFHGTLLLHCDLNLISELLLMPSKQPDYRANRAHEEFVTNLKLPPQKLKAALTRAWSANDELKDFPRAAVEKLAQEKYSSRAWNFKF